MITKTNKAKTNGSKPQKQAAARADQEISSLVDRIVASGPAAPATPVGTLTAAKSSRGAAKYRHIKLGIDVHLDRYVVVRQIDGGAPQPPQRFSPAQFLEWVRKQTELAEQVYICYDAWNRLAEVGITGGAVQGTYRYDGLNRRIQSITSSTRDFYYSNQWQVLE